MFLGSRGDTGEQWPLPLPETPKIIHLDVKCEKSSMKGKQCLSFSMYGLLLSVGAD